MAAATHEPVGHGEGGGTIRPYAIVAEFHDADAIVAAAAKARDEGYRHMDAYTPFPVHGLEDALHFSDPKIKWTIGICGFIGAIVGFALQFYVSAVDYPMNVGGRPMVSWPSFVPVTFECTVLFASFGAVIGMLAFNGLPRPHHPIFETPRFDLASQTSFFLAVEATDPKYDRKATVAFLESLGAYKVSEVTYNPEDEVY